MDFYISLNYVLGNWQNRGIWVWHEQNQWPPKEIIFWYLFGTERETGCLVICTLRETFISREFFFRPMIFQTLGWPQIFHGEKPGSYNMWKKQHAFPKLNKLSSNNCSSRAVRFQHDFREALFSLSTSQCSFHKSLHWINSFDVVPCLVIWVVANIAGALHCLPISALGLWEMWRISFERC